MNDIAVRSAAISRSRRTRDLTIRVFGRRSDGLMTLTLRRLTMIGTMAIAITNGVRLGIQYRTLNGRMRHGLCILVTTCWLASTGVICGDDWPGFRGPNGDGVASDQATVTHWGSEKNIAWRVPLNGTGNGSPIIVDGRVLLTCSMDLGRRRTLHCFDLLDGRELWQQTVTLDTIELTHKSNPYCGTTPVSNGQVVAVWHGTGGIHVYTLEGQRLWSHDFGTIRHLWGYGTSPVIYQDRLVLHSGANQTMFVAALQLSDGLPLWKTDEPGGQTNETPDGKMTGSWCTPAVVNSDGKDWIVCGMPTRVVAYDPDDGRIDWTCGGLGGDNGDLVYASPLSGNGIVVVMSGYKGPALGVRLGGAGDVTETHRLWHTTKSTPQRIGSGVVVGDFIYMANADGGTIQCLEVATGRQRWRQRVVGGPHWASTVMAGGIAYATNQSGVTRVFRPNPDRFELIAENNLSEPVNATPALADNRIVVRTAKHLYCISQQD